MALSDHLTEIPRRGPGTPCSVGALYERLQGAELDALDTMMHKLGWSQERIYQALVKEGHYVGKQTINRHRSQACRCFQEAP